MAKHNKLLGSFQIGRSRKVHLWRFLCYIFFFICLFFSATHYQEFLPAAEKRQIFLQAHPSNLVVSSIVEEEAVEQDRISTFKVQEAIVLPENVLLFVSICKDCSLLKREEAECSYGRLFKTQVISVDLKEPELMLVRCMLPPKSVSQGITLTIRLKEKGILVPSQATFPENSANGLLAYEVILEQDTAIVMVKGLNLRSGRASSTDNLLCVFGSQLNRTIGNHKKRLEISDLEGNIYKTNAKTAAQEIVRCELPKGLNSKDLQGMKVYIWETRRGLLPSVARININYSREFRPASGKPPHNVCACTMLWNQASFLKEWILYHHYLGIKKWFIYDNNSDDEIEEVINSLDQYNVTRHAWPWLKSQEAGFSHCALRARQECEWVVFMDVDEFLNPIQYIHDDTMPFAHDIENQDTVMDRLISNVTSLAESDPHSPSSKIGEIRIDCHSFGPSRLKKKPIEGLIMGYTCRMNRTERHKSIILSSALNQTLINVVHHFHLGSNYRYIDMPRGYAVVNHYKYQVWEVFKAKFFRRVATYVSDWQDKQNVGSNDRAPGLGTEPVEPKNWSDRFCEVVDTTLRNFTLQALTDPTTHLLPWEHGLR